MVHFHNLQFNNKDPVYIQIAYFVKRQIHLGFAENGDKLPSRREMAALLNVNPNTVQKAFKLMEEEGYVHTTSTQGSTVYTNEAIMKSIEEELTKQLVDDFIKSAKEVSLSIDRVTELLREQWNERE